MARISEKSPLFRTKDKMCNDIAAVLNSENLSLAAKRSVIDNVLWVWTEFDGKYEGCKYWSSEAIVDSEEDKDLIHEHLIPRKIIREQINNLEHPTGISVHKLLEMNCIGVVITKEEDETLNFHKLRSTMPLDWDKSDIWARYKKAGITVIDTTTETAVC